MSDSPTGATKFDSTASTMCHLYWQIVQDNYLCFSISQKKKFTGSSSRTMRTCFLSSFIKFHSVIPKKCLSQSRGQGNSLFSDRPEIHNFVEDVVICFLSSFIKFCSVVAEKLKMIQSIRDQGGVLDFPICLKNTNLEEDVEYLLLVTFQWILFSSCIEKVENVLATQRPG